MIFLDQIRDCDTSISIPDEPVFQGSYPVYHALWHLVASGVIDNLSSFSSDAWRDASDRVITQGKEGARVAIIDTAVDWEHPNLVEAIDRVRMLDLTERLYGIHPVKSSDVGEPNRVAAVQEPAAEKAATLADGHPLKAFLEHLATDAPGEVGSKNNPISAHGTAMAGLIGARPVADDGNTTLHVPVSLSPYVPNPSNTSVALPYVGADPFCSIVPIVTDTAPDPSQLLYAIAYAELIGADIIVLAATFADPDQRVTGYGSKTTGEGVPDPQGEHTSVVEETLGLLQDVGTVVTESSGNFAANWSNLKRELVRTSLYIPVVCAGGNSDDGLLAYPARLSLDDTNGIISAGARTGFGRRAAYSAGDRPGMEVTVFAYSGDSEELERKDEEERF
ncbi:MAG: S8 family serine peptidase, partial [Pseudomonadota bacterium]